MLHWSTLLEYYSILSVCVYALAYAFAVGPAIYLLLTCILFFGLCILCWVLLSVSLAKYIVSWTVDLTRSTLKIPFKVIRNAPRFIRVLFFEGPVVVWFYLWFKFLLFFDRHVLRRLIYWSGGLRHASGIRISSVNAISPSFSPLSHLSTESFDEFSLKTALSLSNLAKLAYEDSGVIEYELSHAGFNMSYFKVIQYHNTSGFIAVYKSSVIISFRGTEPLNLMHVMTDLQGGLVSLSSLDNEGDKVQAGRAHYGFLEALRLHREDAPREDQKGMSKKPTETIDLHEEDTVGSIFTALFKVASFSMKSFIKSPITLKIPRSNGKITAFQQIQTALSEIHESNNIQHIFCTGHSLGGALATVFFAQAHLSSLAKSMLRKTSVYSFGAPRIGDEDFAMWMSKIGASKRIYKIVNAQDLVPRMPALPEHLPKALRKLPYAESPGTLIHLNPLSKTSATLEELPGLYIDRDGRIPTIEFWGLSGLLSLQTIRSLRTERWLWITARLFMPFVMFDHLASQYAIVLQDLYRSSDNGSFEHQLLHDVGRDINST